MDLLNSKAELSQLVTITVQMKMNITLLIVLPGLQRLLIMSQGSVDGLPAFGQLLSYLRKSLQFIYFVKLGICVHIGIILSQKLLLIK